MNGLAYVAENDVSVIAGMPLASVGPAPEVAIAPGDASTLHDGAKSVIAGRSASNRVASPVGSITAVNVWSAVIAVIAPVTGCAASLCSNDGTVEQA